jgi:hypothetical protein
MECAASPARSARARDSVKRAREPRRRPESDHPEPGKRERLTRHSERPEDVLGENWPVPHQWRHQGPAGALIPPEAPSRRLDRTLQEHGRAVVQRVCQGMRRVDEFEFVRVKCQRAEERGSGGERVDRGTDIVKEARQRESGGAGAAPDAARRFEDEDRAARSCHGDGGREAIRTRADHHDIPRLGFTCPLWRIVEVVALRFGRACRESTRSRERTSQPNTFGAPCGHSPPHTRARPSSSIVMRDEPHHS